MIVVLREDSTVMIPRLSKDISLEAYRDLIDYLGFYRDGEGSITDGIGARTPSAKMFLDSKGGMTVAALLGHGMRR
jgi:hypothetical protein